MDNKKVLEWTMARCQKQEQLIIRLSAQNGEYIKSVNELKNKVLNLESSLINLKKIS